MQITIQITTEYIVFIQGSKYSPCCYCPISLKSYQRLRGTLAMTLRGRWSWLACKRLFEMLDICVCLRHVLSHTKPQVPSMFLAIYITSFWSLVQWYSELKNWSRSLTLKKAFAKLNFSLVLFEKTLTFACLGIENENKLKV